MDTCSSGEEVIIKTRKPYTITKQRERWTEVEHNRFLEALKLYGRAWQRIEEHIGTKTAVQIRSHAQKFFTKLEKEALVKGIPIGQAMDIEIPPPRPKRKPSNPYPRKITSCPTSRMESKDEKSAHPTSSLSQAEHIIDLEKELLPEKMEDENFGNGKETQDGNKYPKKYIIVQGSPGTSSSANKSSPPTSLAPTKSCVFKEFVPVLNEVANMDESNESHITVEPGVNQIFDEFGTIQSFEENGTHNGENLANSHHLEEKLAQSKGNELEQSEKFENMRKNDWQSMQTQARHVAVQILDGSLSMNAPNVIQDTSYEEPMFHKTGGVEPNALTNLSSSGTSEHHSSASRFSINPPFTGFHPIFTPVQNQENYLSLLHASSTFSNLIVSALLQNPAAHTAASFAASFWPSPRIDAAAESSAGTAGVFSAGQMSGTPSVAAIAAATVAAATAWWASRGLLPLCAPFHMGFNYAPASTSTVPPVTNQARADRMDRREETIHPALDAQTLESEFSKDLQEQHSTSKSPSLPPSVCEESKGLKSGDGLSPKENEQAAAVAEVHDSKKPKARKPIDRSSCGSNTPSSSEVETDALDKHGKGKEELREPAVNPIGDANGRRSRSSSSTSDSWKEVSEEGRLAFRALFSRDVLPQSFSPPHGSKNKGNSSNDEDKQNGKEKSNDEPRLDMTATTCANSTTNQEVENDSVIRSWGLLTLGKLKVRHTGFKPYKRCSVEAKESSRLVTGGSQEEEKGTKRIRLEGGAFPH